MKLDTKKEIALTLTQQQFRRVVVNKDHDEVRSLTLYPHYKDNQGAVTISATAWQALEVEVN